MKHLLECLDATARRWPERPAFGDEAGTLTWAEVALAVQRVGTALARQGVQRRPGGPLSGSPGPLSADHAGHPGGGRFLHRAGHRPAPRAGAADHRPAGPRPAGHRRGTRAAAEALGLDCPLLLWESACTEEPDPYLLRRLRQDALDVDLAYVLFTSGSTGAPKGVAVQHRAVLAYSAWAAETFGIDETTVFGNQTPFYFSMSVTDLYTALRTGAQLQVLPKRLFSFPVQLLDYLTTHGVNTLYWVPSAWGVWYAGRPWTIRLCPRCAPFCSRGKRCPPPT